MGSLSGGSDAINAAYMCGVGHVASVTVAVSEIENPVLGA